MNTPHAGTPDGTGPTDDTSQIFDRDELLASIHGDYDLLQQFIELFLRDFPRKIERLRAAAPAAPRPSEINGALDAAALREAAHKILGSARTMRLHRLAAAAEALQQLIDSHTYQPGDLTAGVARVEDEFHRVVAVLKR